MMYPNTTRPIFVVSVVLFVLAWIYLQPSSDYKGSNDASERTVLDSKWEWTVGLFTRLDSIRQSCGDLCGINDMGTFQEHTVDEESGIKSLEAPVDCDTLFKLEGIDASDLTFPEWPPEELITYYTLNGAIPLKPYTDKALRSAYLGGEAKENVWERSDIEKGIDEMAKGENKGTYNKERTNAVRDAVKELGISGKSVLVIGSEKPWLEIAALLAGAAKVTTLEYGAIHSTHPQVHTLTPPEFRDAYLKGKLSPFDAILSFSSLEHSGLGRYGDALNPWGDILSLARAWCVTKPKGKLLLGLPGGGDAVKWNAHREYGPIRWPLITINWKLIDGSTSYSKVTPSLVNHQLHIFEKSEPTV